MQQTWEVRERASGCAGISAREDQAMASTGGQNKSWFHPGKAAWLPSFLHCNSATALWPPPNAPCRCTGRRGLPSHSSPRSPAGPGAQKRCRVSRRGGPACQSPFLFCACLGVVLFVCGTGAGEQGRAAVHAAGTTQQQGAQKQDAQPMCCPQGGLTSQLCSGSAWSNRTATKGAAGSGSEFGRHCCYP